jgi:hypothetical protein
MFQAFKTFFRETEIRGNGEKNGSNPVHFHQTPTPTLKMSVVQIKF